MGATALRTEMGPIRLAIEEFDLLVDDDRATLVFEFKTPGGSVPAAEWYKVHNGKIVEIKLHNDPRPFLATFGKD